MDSKRIKYRVFMYCEACTDEDGEIKEPCSAAMTYHYDLFDLGSLKTEEEILDLWDSVQRDQGYNCLLTDPIAECQWQLKLFVRYNDDGTVTKIYPRSEKEDKS